MDLGNKDRLVRKKKKKLFTLPESQTPGKRHFCFQNTTRSYDTMNLHNCINFGPPFRMQDLPGATHLASIPSIHARCFSRSLWQIRQRQGTDNNELDKIYTQGILRLTSVSEYCLCTVNNSGE